MEEIKYLVEVDGEPVAKDMTLKDATIFVRALFEEYWKDNKLIVSIRRMDCFNEGDTK